MLEKGVTAVLMNSPTTMGSREGDYTLLSATGQRTMKGSKEAVAHAVSGKKYRATSKLPPVRQVRCSDCSI